MFTTTSKCLFNRCILLLIALALALASCTQTGGTPDQPTGNVLEALVHGPIESAFLEPLKDTLHMTTYDGSQKLEDYDLLIFDGDAHTPAALKEDALVIQALRTGKHVLALDMTEAHKKDGLGGVLNAHSCGDSPAYAMRMTQDANGRPLVQVFETRSGKTTYLDAGEVPGTPPTPSPESCEEQAMTASPVLEVDASTAAAFADAFIKRASENGLEPLQTSDPAIPADLIYVTYQFSNVTIWSVNYSHNVNNTTQTASHQEDYTFTVFLNNRDDPQGDFQYILVDIDATGNPTNGTQNFMAAGIKSGTNWSCCYWDEWGWFQDRLTVSIWPQYNDWTTVATSPETENGETSVTTGVSFSIGFNGQQGPTGSFTYSNSVTRNLSDWKVTNESSGLNTYWYYRTNYPVDSDSAYYCNQEIYAGSCYLQYSPNTLSTSNMQLHTQTVFKTPSVIDGSVTMPKWAEHQMADLFCQVNGGIACDKFLANDGTNYYIAKSTVSQNYIINLGAVIPIPIASLTFSPNPAKAGTAVTGTVTLSKPALMDTAISLSSNSQNATVLPTVTVKQGQASVTFQVLTNANGIAAGGQTVATISAFYAQDFQAQLTITN